MSPIFKLFSETGKKWVMTVISFTVLSAVFGVLAYELTKKSVTVVLDGEKQQISAHANTVGELLGDLQVSIGKYDSIKPGLDTKLEEGMKISWVPAVKIKVANAGDARTEWTTAKTVGDFLKKQGIKVGVHDKITPSPDTPIGKGMNVTYSPGYQVDLRIADKRKTVWTTATASTTVRDFLNNRDVKYDDNDEIKPGLNRSIKNVSSITINRIKKVTDVVEESTDYAVMTKKDDSLAKGKEKVLEPGKQGRVQRKYEVTLKNGKEVSRKLIKTETKKKSEDRVVAVGTKTYSPPSRKKSGGDVKKKFYASSTAYTANCGGCSGYTATGINLKANPNTKVIAVDPNLVPLGSRVWVEGYGYAVAGDTGSAVNGNSIDVFFPTKSGAYSWGQRTVLVKVLN